jgi:outer membrane protein OmpA-like peptidoglycan-associated protein
VSRWPAERVAVAAAAALGALALAPGAPAPGAQQRPKLPSTELTLPVVDLSLTVATLDDSVATTESARRVRVTLAADGLFEVDRAALVPAERSRLGDVARRIRTDRPQDVSIEAHTDAVGSDAANDRLSRRRAESVARALQGLLGPATPSFDPVGLGERRPIALEQRPGGDEDPRGRARNRRVSISFVR